MGILAFTDTSPFQSGYNLANPDVQKKKVVVLGTGWAAISFLKSLKDPSYEVQVISPRNYFAFTPLLPSLTNGTVEARSIVEPIRNIFKKVCHFQHSKHIKILKEKYEIVDFSVTETLCCGLRRSRMLQD